MSLKKLLQQFARVSLQDAEDIWEKARRQGRDPDDDEIKEMAALLADRQAITDDEIWDILQFQGD